MRRALVTAQVAISVLVLATGFLFLRNLLRATAISPGFDLRHTVRAEVNLPPLEYRNLHRINAYAEQAVRRLSAIPGIQAAAAACIIPFTDSWRMASDLVFPDTGEQVHAQFHWNAVTPTYFDAIGIPILAGRTFPAGQSGGRRLAIVNRAFVEQYLGRRNPVGAVFRWGRDGDIYQIVAMVETTKNITIGEAPRPQMYVPLSQSKDERTRIQFVMRSATLPAAQLQPVRNTLRQLEPAAGLEVATLYSSIGVAFLPSQVGAALLGSLGVLGLALAMIGLYGVLVYSVTRQTHEIGVRIAIGASRMRIGRMILLEALKLVSAGSAIGIFVAIFAMRPLAIFLVPGLQPDDPLSLVSVVACFAVIALVAVFGPMRRALGIDPAQCFRYE
jgi:predicted permease